MSLRAVAAALFLAAGLIYGLVSVPAQRRAVGASEEFRRARDERREAQSHLADLQRREALRARAAALLAASVAGGAAAASPLRAWVVDSLKGAPVGAVRLTVRPGRSPVAATVRLSAEGGFADLVRLSGHLVRPGSGLILERARFATTATGVTFEMDGLTVEARP